MKKELFLFTVLLAAILHASAQDKLLFRNGNEQPVVVQTITADEVYFTKPGADSVIYKVSKDDLMQLKRANGDSVIYNTQFLNPPAPVTTELKLKKHNPTYNCSVYGDTQSRYKIRRAFIQSTTDSGIIFSVAVSGNSFMARDRQLLKVDVSSIEKLKVIRKGRVGTGMLAGAGIGFFIGGMLGLTGATDYGIFETLSPGENAMIGGIVFGIPGMIIGGIIGSAHIRIPLHKNQAEYEKNRRIIERYSNHGLH